MFFSDETVMRYVDGELDDATCAAIEDAQGSDADLAARIEAFARTKLEARRAMAPLLDEPVPEALRASVEAMVAKHQPAEQTVKPTTHGAGSARRVLVPANDWRRLAAAACVAGVLGGLAGYGAGSMPRPHQTGLQVAGVDPAALAAALSTTPSGEDSTVGSGARRFAAVASFYDSRNTLCREFKLDLGNGSELTSVACDEAKGWHLRFAAATPATGSEYAPASSSADALDAYLASIEAGTPLSADAEATALQSLSEQNRE